MVTRQVGAVREVAGSQPTGMMHLGEEHLLGRPALGPPLLDAPLQRPQLAVGEAAGKAPLQVGEQGLRFQAGVELELRFQFGPDLGERVRTCSPVPVHALTSLGSLPSRRYLRAVLASMPTRTAATSLAIPCRSRRRSFRTC